MTQALFNKHLRYDPDTGLLWWREAGRGKQLDRPVGANLNDKCLQVQLLGTFYKAHRIIWSMVHGDPVPDIIDHIDRNPFNNKLNNLRAATYSLNNLNRNMGVTYRRGRWRVCFRGLDETYATEVEARARREQLLREHGVIDAH